jgi:hypothetical protein
MSGSAGVSAAASIPTNSVKLTDVITGLMQGQGSSYVDQGVAGKYLSAESYDGAVREKLTGAVQNLQALLGQAFNQADITPAARPGFAQEAAAVFGGMAARNIKQAMATAPRSREQIAAAFAGNEFVTVVGNDAGVMALESHPALEAYNETQNSNAVANTISYNLQAARQDSFGETFFPTTVLTHDNIGAQVEMTVHLVYDEVKRSMAGAVSNFGRINIIKAFVDPTIIRNDQTRLYPVVRSGGADVDTTANFVASTDVAPISIVQDKLPVTTAPLKIGQTFDLMAVSQRAALVAAGVLDQTDDIDPSITLDAIYIKLGANGGNKVLKFPVADMAGADFNQAVQGNTRTMSLNFNNRDLMVLPTTTDVTGAPVAQLAAVAGYTARLKVSLFGQVTLDTGETTVNAAATSVSRVIDVNGNVLDLGAGVGAQVAALFTGATVVGYDLRAWLTNANRRQRGQLIDTQTYRTMYTVPRLPPVTALRPLGASEANDGKLVETLVLTTRIRTSNAAVAALQNAERVLSNWVGQADPTVQVPEILGPAARLVNPVFMSDSINVTEVAALTDEEKIANIRAKLVNKLRDMATRMWTTSAYGPADEAITGAAGKPLVLIGVDTDVYRYLSIDGDTRLLGDQFDVRLVTTYNKEVYGKIYMTFGKAEAIGSGVPHPLHFGTMFWCPEVTVMAPIQRNGQTSFELTTAPRFRHVVMLPILAKINVTGIKETIDTKIPVFFHTV